MAINYNSYSFRYDNSKQKFTCQLILRYTMFGTRLKEERNKVKLSQEAFGAFAGVSKQSQINYEKSERYPDLKYLQNISELGCDIQYIVIGVPSSSSIISKEQSEILSLFHCADPYLQKAAVQVLKTQLGKE